MTAIAVRSAETGSFLDRVVDHGIRHALLSPTRRHELARLVYEHHVPFFECLQLNPMATNDALTGGRWMMQLVSLGLETISNGDSGRAVAFLANQSPIDALKRGQAQVQSLIDRSSAWRRHARGRFILTTWEREVAISYVTDHTAIDHILDSSDFTLEAFLRVIKNRSDLFLFEHRLRRLEKELAISKKFLPWDALRDAYRMKPLEREPGPDEAFQSTLHIDWGVWSLLATIGITLHTDHRTYGGVTIGWRAFLRFIPQLGKKGFQKETLKRARRYLEKKWPDASREERELLLAMWQWALEDCAKNPPNAADAPAWTQRVHLMFKGGHKPPDETGVRMGIEYSLEEHPPTMMDVVNASAEVPTATIKKMVTALAWDTLTRHEVEELIEHVDAAVIVQVVPFEAKRVGWVLDEWDHWDDALKRRLIERLLTKAPAAFWRGVSEAVGKTLVAYASGPQKSRLVRRLTKK